MISLYGTLQDVPENQASCHMGGLYSGAYFLGAALGPCVGGWVLHLLEYRGCCALAAGCLLLELGVVCGRAWASPRLLDPGEQDPEQKHFRREY